MVVSGISTVSYVGLRRAAHSMAIDSSLLKAENNDWVEKGIQNAIAAYGIHAVGYASAMLNLFTDPVLDTVCNADENVSNSKLVSIFSSATVPSIRDILNTMFDAMVRAY